MPQIDIRTDGTGGAFEEVFARAAQCRDSGHAVPYHRAWMPENLPIRIETLDGGMVGGAPSVAFILELPQERMIAAAQTSVKLFQMAAIATYSRYGDLTRGAFSGFLEPEGKATLTLSHVAKCPSCSRDIPGACKFCMECGAKL